MPTLEECQAIRDGEAQGNGDKFHINERVYGHHDGGLYLEAGPGFHRMTKAEFKAFKLLNQLGVSSTSEEYVAIKEYVNIFVSGGSIKKTCGISTGFGL